MSKQQIFSFALDIDADNELIALLLNMKNRSSFIRRALREVGQAKMAREDFNRLYDSYEKVYSLYMEEKEIEQYIVPPKHSFR
tara:strand:+ start:712 stop:960 length:249 start_codon:yes stop_codon:yes gene_type:complete